MNKSSIADIIAEMEKMKEPVIDFCIVELASGRMTMLQIRKLLHPIEIDDKMLHTINTKVRKLKLNKIGG